MSPDLEGGAYGGVEDLYREVILEHFKSPRNKGIMSDASAKAEGVNPLCGDQISLTLKIEGDKVSDIKFEGHGCAISQSSASMMTEVIKGKKISDVKSVTQLFKQIFGVPTNNKEVSPLPKDTLGDLEALEGVKKYPVRIKCALLSWNTLTEGLENFKNKRG